jgi:predicted neutral ceramidase superfamily lipid hydrolase
MEKSPLPFMVKPPQARGRFSLSVGRAIPVGLYVTLSRDPLSSIPIVRYVPSKVIALMGVEKAAIMNNVKITTVKLLLMVAAFFLFIENFYG